MSPLDVTHDPSRRSWVESANDGRTDFAIQNLPFGVFRRPGESARGGVAIGDRILDIEAALAAGVLPRDVAAVAQAATGRTLNPLMALGPRAVSLLRHALFDLLDAEGSTRGRLVATADRWLVPMSEAILELPAVIGGFTDFLTSLHHARRMGFGHIPAALESMPIAYNGRASSIRPTRAPVVRPSGQWVLPSGEVTFGPEPALDFEVELGAFIGRGNPLGKPIAISDAAEFIFGHCLLNDWSARAIQKWESEPLGPFLGKSFATTISPWIVTVDALAPYRIPARADLPESTPLLPYLRSPADQTCGALAVELEAYLLTPKMRRQGRPAARIVKTDARNMFWTFAQMVTHHSSNGCNFHSGDLIASGTVSGEGRESAACLAEATGHGKRPLCLTEDEERTWLENGDEVILRAQASREGFVTIGFGECRARIEADRTLGSR